MQATDKDQALAVFLWIIPMKLLQACVHFTAILAHAGSSISRSKDVRMGWHSFSRLSVALIHIQLVPEHMRL